MAKKTARKRTSALASPPPDHNPHALAVRLKLLADPGRLAILLALAGREHYAGELVALLGQARPAVSQQLTLLRLGGLVEPRREGRLVAYSLTPTGRAVADAVRGVLGDGGEG